MITKNEALGTDIGDVIINHRFADNSDATLYEKRYSSIPAANGVFDALKRLNKERFGGKIFLVSKCEPWIQERNIIWLKDNNFYERTGIKPEHVFFCKERREKEKICREHHITHFVDNRLEVLGYMIHTVPNLFLYQPEQSEVDTHKQFLPRVMQVKSWAEIVEKIESISVLDTFCQRVTV